LLPCDALISTSPVASAWAVGYRLDGSFANQWSP
jgi:hypothetical protein